MEIELKKKDFRKTKQIKKKSNHKTPKRMKKKYFIYIKKNEIQKKNSFINFNL